MVNVFVFSLVYVISELSTENPEVVDRSAEEPAFLQIDFNSGIS